MKTEIKQQGFAYGQLSAIAATAGVSAYTVQKVLLGVEGVSLGTKQKVSKAVNKIRRAATRAAERSNKITQQLLNPSQP